VLDLANGRVEGGGPAKNDSRDTGICQTEHLCARFGNTRVEGVSL